MPAIPMLPVAINRLANSHPGILVSVIEAREAELLDRLRRRDIETAILRLAILDTADDLRVEPLYDESLCVVAAREHPLAGRGRLTWPELLRERWVMPPPDCIFYEHVQATLSRAGMPLPHHVIEALSIHIQFAMVLHAGVLSFGMRSQTVFAPGKEFLVRLPFDLPAAPAAVAAVSLDSHEPSPLARLLVENIRAIAGAA
jgi:DNA-binding transcriptional LysR family regulator